MYEQIDAHILRNIKIDEAALEEIHGRLRSKKIKKKTFLLQQGEICDFEAYVVRGCLKIYYLDANGEEAILFFAVEDWWLGDIASFSTQEPTLLFIEALEDSELLLINRADKMYLYEAIPQLERMFRFMIQRAYVVLQNRFFATITQPAEERYLDFLKRYPTIPQRVPQHQIAAYLGISPEFLSKIRAKLAHR